MENLIKLYGEHVEEKIINEIEILKENSNITFDRETLKLGIDLIKINAKIILNDKKIPTLKNLVIKSFGEASVYKYNIKGV